MGYEGIGSKGGRLELCCRDMVGLWLEIWLQGG